jgi:hypothetical protein
LFVATKEMAESVPDLSLQIYAAGPDHATQHAIIVADPKFEFGVVDERLLLIDEWLTPDSSRFWPAGQYAVGQSPPNFDKQFVRDYLETLDWNETPPGPRLTGDVIARTAAKNVEGCERLTGEKLKERKPTACELDIASETLTLHLTCGNSAMSHPKIYRFPFIRLVVPPGLRNLARSRSRPLRSILLLHSCGRADPSA